MHVRARGLVHGLTDGTNERAPVVSSTVHSSRELSGRRGELMVDGI